MGYKEREYNKIVQRFVEERLRIGVNQAKVASVIGITQSNYSKFEKGIYRLNYCQMRLLCEAQFANDRFDMHYIYTGERNFFDTSMFNEFSFEQLLSVIKIIVDYHKFIVNFENDCRNRNCISKDDDNNAVDFVRFLDKDYNHYFCIIKDIREYTGKTQEKMADKFFVDVKKYRRLEKGKLEPDSEIIMRACVEYGVIPGLLLKSREDVLNYIGCLVERYKLAGSDFMNIFNI